MFFWGPQCTATNCEVTADLHLCGCSKRKLAPHGLAAYILNGLQQSGKLQQSTKQM